MNAALDYSTLKRDQLILKNCSCAIDILRVLLESVYSSKCYSAFSYLFADLPIFGHRDPSCTATWSSYHRDYFLL